MYHVTLINSVEAICIVFIRDVTANILNVRNLLQGAHFVDSFFLLLLLFPQRIFVDILPPDFVTFLSKYKIWF